MACLHHVSTPYSTSEGCTDARTTRREVVGFRAATETARSMEVFYFKCLKLLDCRLFYGQMLNRDSTSPKCSISMRPGGLVVLQLSSSLRRRSISDVRNRSFRQENAAIFSAQNRWRLLGLSALQIAVRRRKCDVLFQTNCWRLE